MSENINLPKVSVILPCYNMEKYLHRCVESILSNRYQPIEIILVNDGSQDATPQLIDELAAKHSEIIALHKPNGGVSSARNAGIDIASGDYIMFVDPDDYVEDNFISAPVSKAVECDADLVLFGYKTAWFSNPPVLRDCMPISDLTLKSQADIFDKAFPLFFGMTDTRFELWLANYPKWYEGKELPSACRFLYKRNFINRKSLRFRNLKLGEDAAFVWDCLLMANVFTTSMIASYVYIPLRDGAFATTTSAAKVLESKLKCLEQRDRIATEIAEQRGKDINNLYAGSNIISALQIGFALAETGTYSDWQKYLRNKSVKMSISRISMVYTGSIKRWLPVLLLKLKLNRTLFIAFKLALKLKISPNVW